MIIFLNGPFGIGKTTTARLLVTRIPGAIFYDPEEVGSFVRGLLSPIEWHDDFQDFVLWRILVVEIVERLRATYRQPLVVPMTIWRRDYFDFITEGFRRADPNLICFRLTASDEVLQQRILGRDDRDGAHSWCLDHMAVGLAAARDPAFGIEVRTDDRAPVQVADTILEVLRHS